MSQDKVKVEMKTGEIYDGFYADAYKEGQTLEDATKHVFVRFDKNTVKIMKLNSRKIKEIIDN